jgi:hypothetical protein
VVLAASNGVLGLGGGQEVAAGSVLPFTPQCRAVLFFKHLLWSFPMKDVPRDELGALVDELVKGVLAVGAGLAPDDGLYTSARTLQVITRVKSTLSSARSVENPFSERPEPWLPTKAHSPTRNACLHIRLTPVS